MSAEPRGLALLAGTGWGGFLAAPKLIHHRENAVYFAKLSDDRPVALRLHRDGYQSDAAIAEEMAVCEMLADAGFACPWPYRLDDGGFLYPLPDGQTRATVLQWIDAPPLDQVPETTLPGPDRYRAIGALLADFHLTADVVLAPIKARPAWDIEALTGSPGLWGDCTRGAGISEAERAILSESRQAARARLATIRPEEYGLIHGDALPGNILWRDKTAYLIDFDDCGPGFRLYDLATALIGLCGESTARDIRDMAINALRTGYLEAGGPLHPRSFDDLPLFLMLRAQASAAWAVSRCAADDPRVAAYRARAMTLTWQFLDTATA